MAVKKLLTLSSWLALVIGGALVLGGLWGAVFTYQGVAQEKIVTPEDASLSEKPVRGPFTLMAQADIIRQHALRSTDGMTYAELPREVPDVDAAGDVVLDEAGDPVMVANPDRAMWITATTLITALHVGVLAYVFSGLTVLFGLVLIWVGAVFVFLSTQH